MFVTNAGKSAEDFLVTWPVRVGSQRKIALIMRGSIVTLFEEPCAVKMTATWPCRCRIVLMFKSCPCRNRVYIEIAHVW